MRRLISVRSKQELARELSEDMLGASPVGGHANGETEYFIGLGDLMGPGEWGPGTVRKMAGALFFSPMGSQKPLALSLPFGSGPASWGVGSVAAVVAPVAVMVLLEASSGSEAGSGGHGKSTGPSSWGGALGSGSVATFLMNRGPFFRASGPVYGLPISRSSTRRNCKQMTGMFMGWAHHSHFLLLCSHLNLWEMVPSPFLLGGRVFLIPSYQPNVILSLDHIFLNLSLPLTPSDQCLLYLFPFSCLTSRSL